MNTLLEQDGLQVVNIGLKQFAKDIKEQGAEVIQLQWKPIAGGRRDIIEALDKIVAVRDKIIEANHTVVDRIKEAKPMLIGINLALDAIPGMTKTTILHSGPFVTWENMCGPMKGAVIGALLYEELVADEEEAIRFIEDGKVTFAPCHEYQAVGPMAGVISASMPVHIIKDIVNGTFAYCTINEGLGKVLRFGAYEAEVLERLRYLRDEFMPVMKKALALTDGIDIRLLTAQALQMGDECHNRNKAATALFYKQISLQILQAEEDSQKSRKALEFIAGNDHYFLNLSMPACKVSLEAGQNVEYATLVSTMARNGVDFGIKVSGIGTNTWFTHKANYIQGLYFPGYSREEANPDIGDSAITETYGIGGFAMGGAPAIVRFVGGSIEDALQTSKNMYQICWDINSEYSIPNLDFKGSPMGIDIIKVIETGILPVINTGIAHKNAGVGQIGAGIVNPPMECFYEALQAYVEKYQL